MPGGGRCHPPRSKPSALGGHRAGPRVRWHSSLAGIAAPWCVAAGRRAGRRAPDLAPRSSCRQLPARRVPRTTRRRDLGLPARGDDPASLQRDHPPHRRRHPVPGTRTGPAVQGQARPSQGSGRLRRNHPAHDLSAAHGTGRAPRPRAPRTSLAREPVTPGLSQLPDLRSRRAPYPHLPDYGPISRGQCANLAPPALG